VTKGPEDSDPKERERKLDQAIEMTFPASDPIAVGRPTSTEAQQGRSVSAKGRSGDHGMRFTVGLKLKGKVHHLVVVGEDALIAALKAKCEQPDALSCTSARKIAGAMRGIHLSLGPKQRVNE